MPDYALIFTIGDIEFGALGALSCGFAIRGGQNVPLCLLMKCRAKLADCLNSF